MAKDYQSLLDYAQAPVSPETQQLTGQQTGGGGQGLLDVLSAIGSGLGTVGGALGSGLLQTLQALPEVAAYRQAALGQPEALKTLQEEKKQTKLAGSLTGYLSKPEYSTFAPEIGVAIESGDKRQMAKLALELPKRKKFLDTIQTAPVTDEQKEVLKGLASYDPDVAASALKEMVRVTNLESSKERLQLLKQRGQAEQKAKDLAAKEQRLPENIVLNAFSSNQLDPADPKLEERIAGLLEGQKIPVKKDTVKNLMASPSIQKLIPEGQLDAILRRLGIKRATPKTTTQQPAQTPAGVRKFNPATGQLE